MSIISIIETYHNFKESSLTNRFFKHNDVITLLANLPSSFEVDVLGKSVNGKEINLVKWGKGDTKIMLWSQMHGDEATGTTALFDLFNFLQSDDKLVEIISKNCQL